MSAEILSSNPIGTISPNAIKYWRWLEVITTSIFMGIIGGLYILKLYYGWKDWWNIIFIIAIAIILLLFLMGFFLIPEYKKRTWRYRIQPKFIQLKYGGLINKSNIIIPISQVQHVHTTQNPLLRRYKLCSVKIGTIAYTHEIPALPEREAQQVRQLISDLSNHKLESRNGTG